LERTWPLDLDDTIMTLHLTFKRDIPFEEITVDVLGNHLV